MSKLKCKNGFSLMEVIIITAVISLLAVGIITSSLEFNKIQSQNSQKAMAIELRDEIKKTIVDQAGWFYTYNDTTSNSGSMFGCLRTGTTCAAAQNAAPNIPNHDFSVFTVTNTLFRGNYDPIANPTQGFRNDGSVCDTFVAPPAPATSNCMFRFTFQWSADCSGAQTPPCTNPRIKVAIRFIHNPPGNNVIISNSMADLTAIVDSLTANNTNINSIGQIFYRDSAFDINDKDKICAAYGPGGFYDPTTKK